MVNIVQLIHWTAGREEKIQRTNGLPENTYYDDNLNPGVLIITLIFNGRKSPTIGRDYQST